MFSSKEMDQHDKVEQFIWSKQEDEQYLHAIVAGHERIDAERMLGRVQAIQGELNTRLRQGVSSGN